MGTLTISSKSDQMILPLRRFFFRLVVNLGLSNVRITHIRLDDWFLVTTEIK